MRQWIAAWTACLCLALSPALGAAQYAQYQDTPPLLERMRHELRNQAEELRRLTERLETQEVLIESLREEARRTVKSAQDLSKSEGNTTQTRLKDLEQASQLSATQLDLYRTKVEALASSLEQQARNQTHLEKSLATLLDAIAAEPTPTHGEPDLYRVVANDSLEKIARKHKTSVRVLKELNGLNSDLIIVGQKLKVPKT